MASPADMGNWCVLADMPFPPEALLPFNPRVGVIYGSILVCSLLVFVNMFFGLLVSARPVMVQMDLDFGTCLFNWRKYQTKSEEILLNHEISTDDPDNLEED